MAGDQRAHEVLGDAIALIAGDQHFLDILGIDIADGALDQIAFLMNQARSRRFKRLFANIIPQFHDIIEIALHFRLGAFGSRSAQDDRHAFRHIQFGQNCLQPLAIGHIGDLAADPAAARRIGHDNAITPSQGEIGCQRSPFIATLFLHNLNQHHLTAFYHFLNFILAAQSRTAQGRFLNGFVNAFAGTHILNAITGFGGFVVIVMGIVVIVDQLFAVTDGNAVIIGMNF